MGWVGCRIREGVLYGHPLESTGSEGELQPVPDYPRSLDAAWLIVNELKRSHYSVEIQDAEVFTKPQVRFTKGNVSAMEMNSASVPEAICRAALKIVEMQRWKITRR